MSESRSRIVATCLVLFTLSLEGKVFSQEKITSVRKVGNDVEIKFVGVAGVSYRIERSGALAGWTDPGPLTTNAGLGKAGNHPVHSMNWFDALKWCNAKSQQEGLEPCYYVASSGLLYKTGSPSKVIWDFTKNGYRLPAEAEWEKAARGGLTGARFPAGATISHALANYKGTTLYAYDTSGIDGFHPTYSVPAVIPFTAPVGNFPPNGYGLRDMAGNLREYCWDSHIVDDYSEGYLIRSDSSSTLFRRVTRGGDWSSDAFANRCSHRGFEFPDTGKKNYVGIRLARGRLN